MSIKGTKKVKTIKKSYSVPEFLRSSKKKKKTLFGKDNDMDCEWFNDGDSCPYMSICTGIISSPKTWDKIQKLLFVSICERIEWMRNIVNFVWTDDEKNRII